ncbi:vWA domain-containing protein [Archaeoglobus profundus]|uniref:von Willebrand factor type A n=1 Tax=Archaeoglobus profundus (strain DSM 5631 / JCM 9629 / NBRC 100127 / Av18) TaxID=572546 RepID=D2RGP5_ARCPA|nr:VWA domain-containing protein [Archaeoglobus profundus]ADB57470.1 von Willebrand factor type A [Archaeoglobus profundus DSM 5631]
MKNNLVNVTNDDFIYQLIAQRIEGYLPKDLQQVYRTCEQIQLIATDCYFLHYSLYPFLRSKNEDDVLEEARKFLQDYISSDRYQKIKMLTTLDDEMSLAYSIALAKAVIGKVLGLIRLEHENPFDNLKAYVVWAMRAMVEGGEIPAILDYATEYAEEMVRNANDVRELIGGKRAGKEEGTFKKVLDLAEHMLYVKFMRDIVSFSKKLFSHIPKATYILKKRGRFGEELSGYSLTKRIDRALVRELALPEELFLKKFSGEGFLTKEKLSIAEGAYYILVDKSGSMVGEKTVWARSVALAIYRMASLKRRRYFLRFFDKKTHHLLSDPHEVVDAILKVKSNGGTDITNALRTAVKDLVERGLSDLTNTIVIITDGEDVVEDLSKDLKKANANLISVMIQGENETLKSISDCYMRAELSEAGGIKLLKIVEAS